MPYGISKHLFDQIISTIAGNQHVESAILFGSRAKGNFKPGSDVDIVLKGEELKLKDVLDLQNQLDDQNQPYLFDIIIFQDITEPALVDHIERCGVYIYRKSVASI
jgi:uncharacterized protein